MRRVSDPLFTHRVLLIVALAMGALITWKLSEVFILVFGAIVFAIILGSFASILHRGIGLAKSWSVVTVVLLLLIITILVFGLFGAQLNSQFDILAERLPQNLSKILAGIESEEWGRYLLQIGDGDLTGISTQIAARVAAVFGSVLQFGTWAILMVVAGIYLAAQPQMYHDGMVRLIPQQHRKRMTEVIALMEQTLEGWLLGQLMTMIVVGTLTAIGLWMLGIKAALALGVIAGMFAFIPYVGPILASIPGVLMAATQGPMEALYAALMYGAVHVAEGNLITPLIQAEMIKLPPALTIFAALTFGLLFGPFGVLFGAPLTVVFLVAIETLYIEDVLGDRRRWPVLRKVRKS